MSRVVVFHGPGRPLEQMSIDPPDPRPGEVLVRIACCTLCRSDLHTYFGRRIEATPTILGHEIVGQIEAFGPGTSPVDARGTRAAIGDRVSWAIAVGCGACAPCADDLPQKCERSYKYGHQRVTAERPLGGGLADHVVLVPGTVWFRVPDEVSNRVAAPANCATATVAALLRHAGSVAGRTVLVLGAGVLGVTACAMARSAGATVVLASDPTPTGRDRARSFGATHVCGSDSPELAAHVAEVSQGRGADVVLELAGVPASVQASLSLARIGGVVVLAGTVAPIGTVPLDPEQLVRRMLTIRGVHNYHPRDLAQALAFLGGAGRGFPFEELIAGEHPLEESERAFLQAQGSPGLRILVGGTR